MSETSGFFDAHIVGDEYDRVYLAENFAKYFASFIGNGVFGGRLDSLNVVAKNIDSMKIDVKSGQAWINGYWYENDSSKELKIDTADGVLNRIDAVVVRYTAIDRAISVVIKKGTPAAQAQAPSMQRDANAWELCIAQVKVNAGAIKIVNSNIVDTRFDKNLCGQVTGTVDQIDTTGYGAQLNAFIEDYKLLGENAMIAYLTWLANLQNTTVAELDAILEELKGLIDSNVASALATRIAALENEKPTLQIANITHNLGKYLHCDAYWLEYGAGVQLAGYGPAGGSTLTSAPVEYEMPDENHIKVKVKSTYGTVEAITKLDDFTWLVSFVGNLKSILIMLRNN